MVDIGSIMSVAASLKAAGEIAKAMIGLRDAAALQAKVMDLQNLILAAQSSALAAQSEQFAATERIRDLEAKLSELEGWEATKQRYQLTDYGGETFAYALKKDDNSGEPLHRACPACFENRHRSILQYTGRSSLSGQETLHCPRCKADFNLGTPKPPDYDPPFRSSGSAWAA